MNVTDSLFSDLLQPGAEIRPLSPLIRPAESLAGQWVSPNSPLSPLQKWKNPSDPISEAAWRHGVSPEREDALRENFEERAAILEFDGGLSRDQAEAEAARLVCCATCTHWTPDDVNPVMGLGECAIRPAGTLPLPWPMNTCWRGEPTEIIQ